MTGPFPEESFVRTQGVPLTKMPIRALVTALLHPLSGQTVGEVGTGTGGITAELARCVRSGHVYSMDPSPEAITTARRNLKALGLDGVVTLIEKGAPQGLEGLPLLTRAVIGGHSGDLPAIITTASYGLAPGGRLLVTANMPATAIQAVETMDSLGLAPSIWQVAPSAGHKTSAGWMLRAMNPTFLIWGDRGQR